MSDRLYKILLIILIVGFAISVYKIITIGLRVKALQEEIHKLESERLRFERSIITRVDGITNHYSTCLFIGIDDIQVGYDGYLQLKKDRTVQWKK